MTSYIINNQGIRNTTNNTIKQLLIAECIIEIQQLMK